MMGEQRDNQQRLFYSFNLDEHVPADHLLRGINQFLDLSDLRSYLAPFYSHTGRPSIDPELMIRMLIVGYCFGIRSINFARADTRPQSGSASASSAIQSLLREAAHDTANAAPAGPPVRQVYGGLARFGVNVSSQRRMPAMSYFPLAAGVSELAMTCHVPLLRDHTCRL